MIERYKNIIFSDKKFRKTIGGRWVRMKPDGPWKMWAPQDNGWVYRDDILKREDWGRIRPVRRLVEQYLASRRGEKP
jgi:hypothetical protein